MPGLHGVGINGNEQEGGGKEQIGPTSAEGRVAIGRIKDLLPRQRTTQVQLYIFGAGLPFTIVEDRHPQIRRVRMVFDHKIGWLRHTGRGLPVGFRVEPTGGYSRWSENHSV